VTLSPKYEANLPVGFHVLQHGARDQQQLCARRFERNDIVEAEFCNHYGGGAFNRTNQHLLLRGEMPVEAARSPRQSRRGLDLADGGAVVAALGDQCDSGVQNSLGAGSGGHQVIV